MSVRVFPVSAIAETEKMDAAPSSLSEREHGAGSDRRRPRGGERLRPRAAVGRLACGAGAGAGGERALPGHGVRGGRSPCAPRGAFLPGGGGQLLGSQSLSSHRRNAAPCWPRSPRNPSELRAAHQGGLRVPCALRAELSGRERSRALWMAWRRILSSPPAGGGGAHAGG